MSFDISSLQNAFFEEATELLDGFEEHLLQLEENPEDSELLNSIFRCAHSIKGGSATFGFNDLARFTHSLETLLDGVRNTTIAVTPPLCSLLLESLDQMRALTSAAKGESTEAADSEALIERLDQAANGQLPTVLTPVITEEESWGLLADPEIYEVVYRPGPTSYAGGQDPLASLQELSALAEILSATCETSAVPDWAEFDPQTCYLGWSLMVHTAVSRERLLAALPADSEGSLVDVYQLGGGPTVTPEPSAEPASANLKSSDSPDRRLSARRLEDKIQASTIKVSADKLDRLINLVGELVISQSMLTAAAENFEMSKVPRLLEAVAHMERSSRELQERVMGMRLLPIKMAFGRFPRLVHDLSSAVGKKIELKLVGEETELDKNLIEAIGDPLTHLVRNSVDHGLETPEERRAAGKPEIGCLTVSAFHEGGSIVIEVADDGRGLNRERILQKAIERGLLSSEETYSDEHVYNTIFQPGFSTAEKVTDLSGRGVGMDIVKQAVTPIGGTVRIQSVPGQGVTTRIRLPLTMAILEGQSVLVGGEVYVIPLTSILESIRPTEGDIHRIARFGEVVSVRGEHLPILRLHQAFAIKPHSANPWEAALVLAECDGQKVALLVDELLGQGQVVIKSLETNYRKVDGLAGATILGDGRIALIIDVPALIRNVESSTPSYATAA